MDIKTMAKKICGGIRCRLNGINASGRVYIGCKVNINGGKRIYINDGVCIRPEVDLWAGDAGRIEIGCGTEIGQRGRISIANSLIIGKEVLISPNVYITDCDHEYRNVDVPVINQGIVQKGQKIIIGEGSYIGINAVIVGNVVIGKHCVIGANSVVTKDIPDLCIAVGSPARIINRYNQVAAQWENIKGKQGFLSKTKRE
jgi:acetyltransferase-like isoleucine patch superfamily enzyme